MTNPTPFGNTNIESTLNDNPWHAITLYRFQAPANGPVTSLFLYCKINVGNPKIKGLIYSDNSNVPDVLLGMGDEITVPASPAWTELTGLNVSVTGGVYYWLGLFGSNTSSADGTTLYEGTDGAQPNQACYDNNLETSPPNPWGATSTTYYNNYGSIYADIYSMIIQGPTRGNSNIANGTFAVTLATAPTSGNTLILGYTSKGNTLNPYITGISQTGVSWSPVKHNTEATAYSCAAIWLGDVHASAGNTITITVANGTGSFCYEIADVVEWSNISPNWGYKTAQNYGTGTAANVSQPSSNLLVSVIGGFSSIAGYDTTQSAPQDGWTLLDGSAVACGSFYESLGYLYKIVSADQVGGQIARTTFAANALWGGCTAIFNVKN